MKLFTNKTKKVLGLVGLLGIFNSGNYTFSETNLSDLKTRTKIDSEWQPIISITGLEFKIIQNALRKDAKYVLNDAEAFKTTQDGVIVIRFKDDSLGFFSYNMEEQDKAKIITEDYSIERILPRRTTQSLLDSINSNLTFGMLQNLASEFASLWGENSDANLLSEEKLKTLDQIAERYFSTLTTNLKIFNEDIPHDVHSFAARGNRYFKHLEKLLPNLHQKDVARVYFEYLDSIKAREEDMPNDDDKLFVLSELRNILLNVSDEEKRNFIDSPILKTQADIKRLDPYVYQLIKEKYNISD